MDHPFATLQAHLDFAIEQDALPELITLLEVTVLIIPAQKKKAGFVTHHALEHPATAAGDKATAHAHQLSDRSPFLSERQVTNLPDLTSVLITERNVI